MLAFTRNRGESVVLDLPDGTRMKVHVTRVRGGAVTLAFEVPLSAVVYRAESPKMGNHDIPKPKASFKKDAAS